ncbi:MAG: quinolinate synthase NadA [Bacillota bacterium]
MKELIDEILELRKERNALILAHNYQRPEIQDIADFVGDSLELSVKAAETKAEVLVFCGVHFMAETAAILSPGKKVLLPDIDAGCPMADMVDVEELRRMKNEQPDMAVICYVNTSAEVKGESDACCTSANAVKVVQNTKARKILFVPDRHLGAYVSEVTGKELLLWPGFCPTHARIKPEDILKSRTEYPGAHVVVHPECSREVRSLADAVLGTGGIIRYARERDFSALIVGTETGILYRLRKENPRKTFVAASAKAVCPNMKRTTLEKVLESLRTLAPEVSVSEEIRSRARTSLDRMLALGRN